jgi:fatty-acyl-CoA synthase
VDVPDPAGHRSLVVIAEPATGVEDYRSVARGLRDSANSVLGVRVDRCVITQRGSIPKTPSGKVQRHRCRELIETETVPFVAELT